MKPSLDGTRRGTSHKGPWPIQTTPCCRRLWRNGRSSGSRRWCLATWRSYWKSIGDGWVTHLSQLSKLKALTNDKTFRERFAKAKRESKRQFASWVQSSLGQTVDPDSIFDCQIKRIHEYKRQLLNALRVVVLYNRL